MLGLGLWLFPIAFVGWVLVGALIGRIVGGAIDAAERMGGHR